MVTPAVSSERVHQLISATHSGPSAASGGVDHPRTPEFADAPHEACGVFGIWSSAVDVARATFYGLYALQHRGQESAGICTTDREQLRVTTGMGLVAQVFTEEQVEQLDGVAAIGHNRYSTTGASRFRNAQPIKLTDPYSGEEVAFAHNGNVVNAVQVKAEQLEAGHRFETQTDTEVLAKYMLDQPGDWLARTTALMRHVPVAYSLALLTNDRLMAIRDPYGVRPLCIGEIDSGYVIASETCALSNIGATYLREVRPGELVTIDDDGLHSCQALEPEQPAGCVFEHIYFARPDSQLDGRAAAESRDWLGTELAREQPADADVVIGVPDSATTHALAYARESGIPYAEGLVKNRYVGRTFISPDQRLRDLGAHLKYNTVDQFLAGKRVVVVDDTIVRGTTTPRIVQLLREAGATEVHMRIAAPPIQMPCHYGVDMASRAELIAATHSVEEVRQHIGADSIGYLSIEGLNRALKLGKPTCLACFNGDYPIAVQADLDALAIDHSDLAATAPLFVSGSGVNGHAPHDPSSNGHSSCPRCNFNAHAERSLPVAALGS